MQPSDGEFGPSKGRKFDAQVCSLLSKLGYKMVLQHKDGFDTVADPPLDTINNIRPLLARNDRTAFEFKAGNVGSLEPIVKVLLKKIQNVKKIKNKDLHSTKAGIIVVEGYVPDSVKKAHHDKYGIEIWDFRTLLFLLAKITGKQFLSQNHSIPHEKQLDTSTTVVYVTNTGKNTIRYALHIYYQDPFEPLTSMRFESLTDLVSRRFSVGARIHTVPTYATVTLYSLPGITDDLVSNISKILNEKAVGKIIFDGENVAIFGFDTAPWAYLIT